MLGMLLVVSVQLSLFQRLPQSKAANLPEDQFLPGSVEKFVYLVPTLKWHSNSTDSMGLLEALLVLYLSMASPSTQYCFFILPTTDIDYRDVSK